MKNTILAVTLLAASLSVLANPVAGERVNEDAQCVKLGAITEDLVLRHEAGATEQDLRQLVGDSEYWNRSVTNIQNIPVYDSDKAKHKISKVVGNLVIEQCINERY